MLSFVHNDYTCTFIYLYIVCPPTGRDNIENRCTAAVQRAMVRYYYYYCYYYCIIIYNCIDVTDCSQCYTLLKHIIDTKVDIDYIIVKKFNLSQKGIYILKLFQFN